MENLTNSTSGEPSIELDNEMILQLKKTTKWTMLLSKFGLVVLGLIMAISILYIILSLFSFKPESDALEFLPLLLITVIYFFPFYYLFKFSTFTKQAISSNDKGSLLISLQYLTKHFRYMMILIIILVCLMVIIRLTGWMSGDYSNLP
jgi:hypothetical protein